MSLADTQKKNLIKLERSNFFFLTMHAYMPYKSGQISSGLSNRAQKEAINHKRFITWLQGHDILII